MPFAGNIPFDSEPLAPTNFVVHTPSGEPAGLAQVEVYRGDMVNIHIAGDASSEIKISQADHFLPSQQQERRSIPVNDDGTFETPVTSPTKFVIVHESGYAIHAPTAKGFQESNGKKVIKLQPWSQASGRITLNKKPPAERRVSARWESFPFSPAMLNLDANERVHGPPLVSITQTVDIGENGEYTFTKLPPGRLRLKLAAPEKEGENDTDPKVAGNVQWWQSAVPNKAGPNPFPQDAPSENVFDFSVITVKGRIKLTDEIFERRVTVNRTANGVEAGQAELMVSFNSLVDREWEKLYAGQTLEQAVRKTVVWGRPGGKREMLPSRNVSENVGRNGAFECVLTAGAYNVSLLMLKQRDINDEGKAISTYEALASDIAKVSEQAGGDDADNLVNLGEIEVHLREQRTDDFGARGRWMPPDSDSRDFPETPPNKNSGVPFLFNAPRDSLENRSPRNRAPSPLPDPLFAPDNLPPRAGASPSPAVAPVDQAIAKLVTDLLAAGDRRTRENMRTPLKELLQQKFDAEQKAREALLTELRKRLEEASRQVTERKQKKDQIVTQQLDRMMSLPEDRFLPMDAVKAPVDPTPYNPNDFYPPDELPKDTPMRSEPDDDRLGDARLQRPFQRPSRDRTPAREQEPKPAEYEEKMPPAAGIEPK
ncbi:hypothetical protein Fuma_00413 [Fuerstiella marisgermanici]|uniref:Uncharacterized protein n=2 Tax=Fuerstiella marisgermanici TaxID=1891926 RepID=A0A1P8W9V5_9PLAN|nr:hypothetical protein Fuma_00413 [Fuerstiella marisgermanici]